MGGSLDISKDMGGKLDICRNNKALKSLFFVEWFFRKTKQYCSDLKRMSSSSTDTCATMRKTWTRPGAYLLLKYTFFIPCNSHKLQLLIKDILKSQPFCDVIARALPHCVQVFQSNSDPQGRSCCAVGILHSNSNSWGLSARSCCSIGISHSNGDFNGSPARSCYQHVAFLKKDK
jgi:hypothetical protein